MAKTTEFLVAKAAKVALYVIIIAWICLGLLVGYYYGWNNETSTDLVSLKAELAELKERVATLEIQKQPGGEEGKNNGRDKR